MKLVVFLISVILAGCVSEVRTQCSEEDARKCGELSITELDKEDHDGESLCLKLMDTYDCLIKRPEECNEDISKELNEMGKFLGEQCYYFYKEAEALCMYTEEQDALKYCVETSYPNAEEMYANAEAINDVLTKCNMTITVLKCFGDRMVQKCGPESTQWDAEWVEFAEEVRRDCKDFLDVDNFSEI